MAAAKYQLMAETLMEAEMQINAAAAQLREVVKSVQKGVVTLPEGQAVLMLALRRLADQGTEIADSVKWNRQRICRMP